MQCKQCEYRLWALNARECPECGRPFLPSEFEFVPGSVRYTCPHCNQSYYGTSEKGHLVPSEFNCVNCGRHIHMDEMILFPATGVEEDQTRPTAMPWLERQKIGRVKAWFRTMGMALVAPGSLIQQTPPSSSTGQAWWFACVTQWLFMLSGFSIFMMFPLIAVFSSGASGGGVSTVFGSLCLGSAIFWLLGIAIWGLIAHGTLLITGGAQQGLGRTYQAICYSSAGNLLIAIPCVGFYLALIPPIWWIVGAILMLRDGQKVHGGRATLAVLIVPLIAVAGLAYLVTWTVGTFTRFSSRMNSPAFVQVMQNTGNQQLTAALLNYAQNHSGQYPPHAIELLSGNYAPANAMLIWDAQNRGKRVHAGEITLDAFEGASLPERQKAVEKIRASLPAGTVAHRLGDFVFTYHGIPPGCTEGKLWLVIASPLASPPGSTGPAQITVGLVDGSQLEFPPDQLPARLQEQNRLRATYSLPPLPDPADVNNQKAAVSTSPATQAEQEN